MLPKLLIATSNKDKIEEISQILASQPIFDLIFIDPSSGYIQPEETGRSFEENACLKALEAARFFKRLTLADDSGLVVPSLNGNPGIFSARYAGKNATYSQNRHKLLAKLQGKLDRSAYFQCSLALASPQKILKTFEGKCVGTILPEERGTYSFGYDPLFVKQGFSETFAQFPRALKHQHSHRGAALKAFLQSFQDQPNYLYTLLELLDESILY